MFFLLGGLGVQYPTLLDIWENPISGGKCLVFFYAPLVRIKRVYAFFVTWL